MRRSALIPPVAAVIPGIAAAVLFAAMTGPVDFPIPDTGLFLSAGDVYALLGGMSPAQTEIYVRMLRIDFAFALAYGVFLAVTVTLLTRSIAMQARSSPWRPVLKLLPALPLAAAGLDLVENTMILTMIDSMPNRIAAAEYVGVVTTAKWGLVTLTVVIIAAFGVFRGVRAWSPGCGNREKSLTE